MNLEFTQFDHSCICQIYQQQSMWFLHWIEIILKAQAVLIDLHVPSTSHSGRHVYTQKLFVELNNCG